MKLQLSSKMIFSVLFTLFSLNIYSDPTPQKRIDFIKSLIDTNFINPGKISRQAFCVYFFTNIDAAKPPKETIDLFLDDIFSKVTHLVDGLCDAHNESMVADLQWVVDFYFSAAVYFGSTKHIRQALSFTRVQANDKSTYLVLGGYLEIFIQSEEVLDAILYSSTASESLKNLQKLREMKAQFQFQRDKATAIIGKLSTHVIVGCSQPLDSLEEFEKNRIITDLVEGFNTLFFECKSNIAAAFMGEGISTTPSACNLLYYFCTYAHYDEGKTFWEMHGANQESLNHIDTIVFQEKLATAVAMLSLEENRYQALPTLTTATAKTAGELPPESFIPPYDDGCDVLLTPRPEWQDSDYVDPIEGKDL